MTNNEKETICILLASYNGEKFIGDQIESLLAQTYTNWRLFIRDDGSIDQTVSIIKKYAQKDKRISIIEDDKKNLGSCQNFATLYQLTRDRFSYIMFCDQDDYWLPFKIEETLLHMQHLEQQQKKTFPFLVYTNFQYTDQHLKEIKSKKNFETTKVSNLGFAHLLAQNPAYGCTMMMNKSLADIINQIPAKAENHDYWVALVASALGKISYLNRQTILYRQHSNNISTNYDSNSFVKRLKRIVVQRKNFEDVRAKIAMALVFRDSFYGSLKESHKKILNQYISLFKRKTFFMLFNNIQNGVRRQTLPQTILFYISIFMLKGFKN